MMKCWFFACFPVSWPPIKNITYNVIGGVLTILVSWLFQRALKRWQRRRFKKIFGPSETPYFLVYGSLVVRPELQTPFFLSKEPGSGMAFSAERTASACEIRAASYVASTLGRDGNRFSIFVDDESLKSRLDTDFISFGAMSNRKTVDIFNNSANDLAEMM